MPRHRRVVSSTPTNREAVLDEALEAALVRLMDVVARLRDPETGCPWDRKQDHASLRPYMIEEAHEAVAAIDSGDASAIAEELGDVLLQVVLHSQVAAETGTFSLADVMDGLSAKLVRRHPHVFGDASNDLPSIYRRWEEIKASEKASTGQKKTSVLPTLLRARKAIAAYERHTHSQTGSVAPAAPAGATQESQAGKLLLDAVSEVWQRGIDPEIALRSAVEQLERETGR